MADIELVIKIDEKTYKDIKKGKIYSSIRDVPLESVSAIANGTPLPKGHGRLIDADSMWDIYHSNDYDFYEAYDNLTTIIDGRRE